LSVLQDVTYSTLSIEVDITDSTGLLMKVAKGTGFCVSFPGGSAVITNRRIVDPTWSSGTFDAEFLTAKISLIRIRERRKDGSTIAVELDSAKFFYSDNRQNDVAFMPLASASFVSGAPVHFQNYFDSTLLSRAEEFGEQVGLGDAVCFPGYPQWPDSQFDQPIIRMAWIVTDPTRPITSLLMGKGNGLLTEGFTSVGHTGAPVFSLKALRVIGISAGWYNPPKGREGYLTFVYKSSVIWECAEKAFGPST
jgi:hypothetical protein